MKDTKLKIIIILIVSFFSMKLISKTIFIANTPRINNSTILALIKLPSTMLYKAQNFLASLSENTRVNPKQKDALRQLEGLPVAALNQVGTGVYAKEDGGSKITYVKITKEVEWEERIIEMDGKQIKVRFPKGTFK